MSFHLEQLTLRVETSAYWRAEKAEQYPDDKRNIRSSEALTKLEKGLSTLEPNDKLASTYEEIMERAANCDDSLHRISEIEQRYISRYGFDYPQDGDPASFLEGLIDEVAEVVKEAEEEAAEEERDAAFEEAKEQADEAAKEAAHEAAKEAAEEAAKEAAEEAYEETYREVYEKTYREALIEALQERGVA